MPDEIAAFGRREEAECGRKEGTDLIEAARTGGAEEGFELGEGLFDRVEVGTVRRQKPEVGAGSLDRRSNRRLLVDDQVVEHDDIPAAERRHQDLFDIGEERGVVDRPVEYRRSGEPVEPQRRDHRVRLPVAARRVIVEARAAQTAAIPSQQIGRDATLIEKDVLPDIAQRLPPAPPAARRRHVRSSLFVGVYGFF